MIQTLAELADMLPADGRKGIYQHPYCPERLHDIQDDPSDHSGDHDSPAY